MKKLLLLLSLGLLMAADVCAAPPKKAKKKTAIHKGKAKKAKRGKKVKTRKPSPAQLRKIEEQKLAAARAKLQSIKEEIQKAENRLKVLRGRTTSYYRSRLSSGTKEQFRRIISQ